MSNLNDELNNVPTEIQEELNTEVETVEVVEVAEAEVNHNLNAAAELTRQNPQRAREILKDRLSRLSPEEIENLRAAKAAKIEAQQAEAEAAAAEVVEEVPEISEEELARNREMVKNRLATMPDSKIEAIREAKAAKLAAQAAEAAAAAEAAVSATVGAAATVAAATTTAVAATAVVGVSAVAGAATASAVAPAKKKKKSGKRGPRISYESKQAFSGFMFVLPWFIGFLLFFAYPCFQTLQFSFSRVAVFQQYACTWIAFENYAEILTSEATFMQALTNTLSDLAVNVPVVLIFSLFVAVLLNRKFPGRGLVRGIFFLPVIVTTGVVMSTFSSSDSNAAFSGDMNNGILFQMTDASEFLVELGLNETITQYMMNVADRIFDVVWDSGVQILLFLAALQGISPQLYEASSVEGATAWETFWLITFPNVAPIILVNIVYTVVDTYNDPENPVLSQINTLMNVSFNLGGAAAASWTFFLVIFALLGIIFGVYALLTKKSS